jgi:acyl carrier protein
MISDASKPAVRGAILDIAASVFEIGVQELRLEDSPQTVDRWDSLNHLKLITAVESAFNTRLPMKTVLKIDTIKALIEAVESRVAS